MEIILLMALGVLIILSAAFTIYYATYDGDTDAFFGIASVVIFFISIWAVTHILDSMFKIKDLESTKIVFKSINNGEYIRTNDEVLRDTTINQVVISNGDTTVNVIKYTVLSLNNK